MRASNLMIDSDDDDDAIEIHAMHSIAYDNQELNMILNAPPAVLLQMLLANLRESGIANDCPTCLEGFSDMFDEVVSSSSPSRDPSVDFIGTYSEKKVFYLSFADLSQNYEKTADSKDLVHVLKQSPKTPNSFSTLPSSLLVDIFIQMQIIARFIESFPIMSKYLGKTSHLLSSWAITIFPSFLNVDRLSLFSWKYSGFGLSLSYFVVNFLKSITLLAASYPTSVFNVFWSPSRAWTVLGVVSLGYSVIETAFFATRLQIVETLAKYNSQFFHFHSSHKAVSHPFDESSNSDNNQEGRSSYWSSQIIAMLQLFVVNVLAVIVPDYLYFHGVRRLYLILEKCNVVASLSMSSEYVLSSFLRSYRWQIGAKLCMVFTKMVIAYQVLFSSVAVQAGNQENSEDEAIYDVLLVYLSYSTILGGLMIYQFASRRSIISSVTKPSFSFNWSDCLKWFYRSVLFAATALPLVYLFDYYLHFVITMVLPFTWKKVLFHSFMSGFNQPRFLTSQHSH